MPESVTIIVPTPVDLLGELEAVRQLALNHIRVFETKYGGVQEYSQPDYRAAIAATRVKAEICGYIRQQPQFETRDLMAAAMRKALADPELRKLAIEQLRELEPSLLTDGHDTRAGVSEIAQPGSTPGRSIEAGKEAKK